MEEPFKKVKTEESKFSFHFSAPSKGFDFKQFENPQLTQKFMDPRSVELSLLPIPTLKASKENLFKGSLGDSPLVTYDALYSSSDASSSSGSKEESQSSQLRKAMPMLNLLGALYKIKSKRFEEIPKDPRIYVNSNAPASFVVCGVQGSGKSHTTSCFIEGALIKHAAIGGQHQKLLSACVFHYDSVSSAIPCEAAYIGKSSTLGVKAPEAEVLVSPSNYNTMKRLYENSVGPEIKVSRLYIQTKELTVASILSLMAIKVNEAMPLYMQSILQILREMGDQFEYERFKRLIEQRSNDFNPSQKEMLNLRLGLLESFLFEKSSQRHDRSFQSFGQRFKEGKMVIVDLTDPLVDPGTATSLFEICLQLFENIATDVGKLLVVDEAHKYLSGQSRLTEELVSMVRQQRHRGLRVVISTQEPTVVPSSLLDLSTVIVHRFSSPEWANHLRKHVASDDLGDLWLEEVAKLETGQAFVFSPNAIGLARADESEPASSSSSSTVVNGISSLSLNSTPPPFVFGASKASSELKNTQIKKLGRGWMLIRTRERLTNDGGKSIMAIA